MIWVLWMQAIGLILVLSVIVYVGWRGSKKARKDILELARAEEKKEEEGG